MMRGANYTPGGWEEWRQKHILPKKVPWHDWTDATAGTDCCVSSDRRYLEVRRTPQTIILRQ